MAEKRVGEGRKRSRFPLPPCDGCRRRHIKCDSQQLVCRRCAKTNARCSRIYKVRFRHSTDFSVPSNRSSGDRYEFTFANDQPWVRIGKSVCFVDETSEVTNAYAADILGHSDSEEAPTSNPARDGLGSSQGRERSPGHGQEAPPRAEQPENSPHYEYTQTPWNAGMISADAVSFLPLVDTDSLGFQLLLGKSPPDLAGLYPAATNVSQQDGAKSPAAHGDHEAVLSQIYLDSPSWPLKDSQEAFLFQCFIRDIAPILDFCDHERHFERVVPDRAPTCPPLLNAVLGVAAKRLGRIGNIDPLLADKYYQNCLVTLIPALSNTAAVADENLLAAIILLRFMEEADLPFSTTGPQSHLIGTRVFLAAQKTMCDFTGLRLASFWIALRQETFIAMVHSRPVHPSLMLKDIATILDETSCECGYANRAIVHCASCIQYCFGGQEQSVTAWDELNTALDRWFDEMPWYFHSIAPTDDKAFLPNMPYRSDPVIAGMQHYYLARLLLTAHDPRTPKLGTARKLALEGVQERCKSLVRIACGIAESNPQTAPANVYASVAIALAGDLFTKREEQKRLFNFFTKIDESMAWSTASAQDDMRDIWGVVKCSRGLDENVDCWDSRHDHPQDTVVM